MTSCSWTDRPAAGKRLQGSQMAVSGRDRFLSADCDREEIAPTGAVGRIEKARLQGMQSGFRFQFDYPLICMNRVDATGRRHLRIQSEGLRLL